MTAKGIDLATVDLDNCHREPIHIPGFIQPHGLLFALDFYGRLTHVSRGAYDTLMGLPLLGASWPAAPAGLDPGLWRAVTAALNDEKTGQESALLKLEVTSGDVVFDAVIHVNDDRLIVELEQRASSSTDLAAFALLAYRHTDQLRNRKDIATLLREAVAAVRQLTGFDRVMAYRFHADDSGEVVAEECLPELESFLHRRFPASDIPPQARSLYVRNPLRLIADIDDDQVPIDAADATARPLDLTYSVLRSVSPIHIEYLRNIHVQASMSLSIVVHDRLWGLIACHHGVRHRVPYAVRTTCDVLSEVLSSSVHSNVERSAAKRRLAAVAVIERMTKALRNETLASSMASDVEALGKVIDFDASLCVLGGFHLQSNLSGVSAALLLRWLDAEDDSNVVAVHEARQLPEPLQTALSPFCGLLALCIDRLNHGWIVLLRREQVETIVWSGIPAKLQRIGPLGTRLTPQGSLAEWRQTVEGTAVAWSEQDLAIAHDLTEALSRAGAAQAVRQARARAQMLAILGHDLRDPVHSISMMGELLERGAARSPVEYGARITRAIGRMKRLIGEVFEMSRVTSGLGLNLALVPGDLVAFVGALVDDARMAHPESIILLESPPSLMARFDPDRMAQVVSNLLSNARNHGVSGEPIWVRMADDAGCATLSVANLAPPIAQAQLGTLFDAFKPESVGNVRNPDGLGLGLYIASEVAKGHGGTLDYSHDGSRVTFTLTLPRLTEN
ncbi:MAG: GAF domain-containing protein [Pseudomonas sp.]|nr:MAG: GAF domain-containing protein [Pseudomonas sp.]